MSEKNIFKGMILDKGLIDEMVLEFCHQNFIDFDDGSIEFKQINDIQVKYIIDHKEKYVLNLYYRGDGSTTLSIVGNEVNKTLAKEFGHFLMSSKCKLGSKKDNMNFVVSGIGLSDFETLCEWLNEDEDVKCFELKTDCEISKTIIITGMFNDKNTITYYKTRDKILVQGKPLPVFSTITYLIGLVVSEENIIASYNSYYEIEIDKDDVQSIYDTYLPYSADFHKDNFKKSLLQSIYHLQIHGDLFDSTSIAFPALRCLEGHLDQTLKKYGIIRNNHSFGNIFHDPAKTGNFVLTPSNASLVSNTLVETHFNKCYNYLRSKRNVFFHWEESSIETGSMELNPIITDITIAHKIIIECLNKIDEFYKLTI